MNISGKMRWVFVVMSIFVFLGVFFTDCSEATENDLNVKNYGAVGDGYTDDTEAFKELIEDINRSNNNTVYIPEGTYIISEKIGEITSNDNLIYGDYDDNGPKSIIKAADDIGCVMKLKGKNNRLEHLMFDFDNHTCTYRYGIFIENETYIDDISMKNIDGKGVSSQYPIHINTKSKHVEIKNSSFKNVFNLGDDIITNQGFAGFIFISGNGLVDDDLYVLIEHNDFENTRTKFLPKPERGSKESEKDYKKRNFERKVADMDANAIRCYIEPDTKHNIENLRIDIINNDYRKIQKTVYKINNAICTIKEDWADLRNNNKEGDPYAYAIGQFRECDTEITYSNYKGEISTAFFVLIDSVQFDAREIDAELTNDFTIDPKDGIIEPTDKLPVNGQKFISPTFKNTDINHDITLTNITTHNIHYFIRSNSLKNLTMNTINMYNGKVICNLTNPSNIDIRHVDIETEIKNGGTSERTICITGSGTENYFEDITINDLVPRSNRENGYPYCVSVSASKDKDLVCNFNDVEAIGEKSRFQRFVIRGVSDSRFEYIKMNMIELKETKDCQLINPTYDSIRLYEDTKYKNINLTIIPEIDC